MNMFNIFLLVIHILEGGNSCYHIQSLNKSTTIEQVVVIYIYIYINKNNNKRTKTCHFKEFSILKSWRILLEYFFTRVSA